MTSKHTQGPWIAKGMDVIKDRSELGPKCWEQIASCSAPDKNFERASANAALIAAAPDLLEALKCQNAGNLLDQEGFSIDMRDWAIKVLEQYGYEIHGPITYQEFVQNKFEAAITKAEGDKQ